MQKRWEASKDSNDSIFWRSWKTSLKHKKIEASQHFGTLGAPKHWEAPIFSRFNTQKDWGLSALWDCGSSKTLRGLNFVQVRIQKIEASQYFGTLGAPKPGEASIFLGFKCKNAGRPQKTLMTQSFGGLGRPALNTKRLRPLSILGLWELQKVHWEAPIFSGPRSVFASKSQKNWGLSALWDSESSKTLRGPNLFEVQYSKRLRPLITLGLWELQNTERPQSCWGPGFQKIGASQCFAAPTVPKCWEASIFLIWGTVSQDLQKIESFESFGASQRFCFKITKKLRPEASQHFGTLGAPKHWEAPIFSRFNTQKDWGLSALWDSGSSTLGAPKHWEASILLRSRIPKDWGLSVFCSSHSSKVLRGLNLSDLGYSLPRPPKDWVFWVFWGLAAFLLQNHKKIEASQHFGTLGAPKHWKASIFSIFGTPLYSATPRPDPALHLKRDKRVGQWGGGGTIYIYIYVYVYIYIYVYVCIYTHSIHTTTAEQKFSSQYLLDAANHVTVQHDVSSSCTRLINSDAGFSLHIAILYFTVLWLCYTRMCRNKQQNQPFYICSVMSSDRKSCRGIPFYSGGDVRGHIRCGIVET